MHQALRLYKDKLFLPLAKLCLTLHLSASQVSIIGAVIGLIGLPGLYFNYWWFVGFSIASFLCDGIDGTLARYTKQSTLAGAKLDYTIDVVLGVLQMGAIILWLQQPLWVISFNFYLGLQAVNWLFGSPLTLSTNRLVLLVSVVIGLPHLGLGVTTAYSIIMAGRFIQLAIVSRKHIIPPGA